MNKLSADAGTTVRRHIFPFEYIQCISSYWYWLLGNLNLGLKLDGMLYRQILNSGIAVTWRSSILLGGRKLKETSVDRKWDPSQAATSAMLYVSRSSTRVVIVPEQAGVAAKRGLCCERWEAFLFCTSWKTDWTYWQAFVTSFNGSK